MEICSKDIVTHLVDGLNTEQMKAFNLYCEAIRCGSEVPGLIDDDSNVTIVQGPPGTGKTHLINVRFL